MNLIWAFSLAIFGITNTLEGKDLLEVQKYTICNSSHCVYSLGPMQGNFLPLLHPVIDGRAGKSTRGIGAIFHGVVSNVVWIVCLSDSFVSISIMIQYAHT